MPQMQLPLFSAGANLITHQVGYEKRDGKIWYFLGQLPLFSHDEDDVSSFKFFTSQLVVNGHVKQAEIARAFGVPIISIKRNVKRLREKGLHGFFERTKRKKRDSKVLTEEVLKEAQELLDGGYTSSELEKILGVKAPTIRKAISQGRLQKKN